MATLKPNPKKAHILEWLKETNMFFNKRKKEQPQVAPVHSSPKEWPGGIMIQVESGKVYYIRQSKRYLVPTTRILQSWNLPLAFGTLESLKQYKFGGKLGFRDGSLIQDISDGRIYLVSDNKIRHVVNPDILPLLGIKFTDMIIVARDETALHEEGAELGGI